MKNCISLKNIISPANNNEEISIDDIHRNVAVAWLRRMLLIRMVETKLADERRGGAIGGPVHLGVGQEAIPVGLSTHLRSTDRIFGAHRSHSHLLALGSSVHKLFAEILGKNTGHSKGMGGSMHLWDRPLGFYGSVPIVAGTVPLAVGAGLAAKMQNTGDIAVAYLGDGAVEEGVVHESLNLAQVQNIPVLFIVENNLFASHMHISSRQPSDATIRFADANLINSYVIDGNDISQISRASKEAVDRARAGGGPSFIEAVTYRWYGHVDWRDDIDVGVNRSEVDLYNWKLKDPISRLRKKLILLGCWTTELENQLITEMAHEIEEAWSRAVNDPYPTNDALIDRVFAK